MQMRTDYRERLAGIGCSRLEIEVVELAAIRCGLLRPACEHERPRFLEVFPLDAAIESDSGLTFSEARWRLFMAGLGFRLDAVILIEQALGLMGEGGTA